MADTEPAKPEPDLADAVPRLARGSVLVLGDAMLDRYVYGSVSRISPEAPVPVLVVDRELALPGGAGNVVRNLTALGAAAAFISVVGDDQAGSELTGLIGGQPNVEPWLLVQGGRCTTVKTRFVARGQQLLRTDQEVTGAVHPKLAERMLRIAGDALAATSVTVLSDYRKGVLGGDTANRLIAACRAAGRRVVVDPRGPGLERYAGADVLVPSATELAEASGEALGSDAAVATAATKLRNTHRLGAVVTHRGAAGLSVTDAEGTLHLPYDGTELFDSTGEGDTVVAAIAASLAAGLDLRVAARVAALAMAVTIGQPGLAVARAQDLLAMLTPRGRALRKVVSADQAAEQIERWAAQGLRTAWVLPDASTIEPDRIEAARATCDRLAVCVPAEQGEDRMAALAQTALVDLVCPIDAEGAEALLSRLRPALVMGGDAPSPRLTELVRGWGGNVVSG